MTGRHYLGAPTAEIIASQVSILAADGTVASNDVVLPGRIFVTNTLRVDAGETLTYQPGAIVAGTLISNSGIDGYGGDTVFAPGDLLLRAPTMLFQAGNGAPTSMARLNFADNTPRLQGATLGSLPDFLSVTQDLALHTQDLPAIADFGDGTFTTFGGMDYRIVSRSDLVLDESSALGPNTNIRGADLELRSGGDLISTQPLTAGAFRTFSAGATSLTGLVTVTGGTFQGQTYNAVLEGGAGLVASAFRSPTVAISYLGDVALTARGDAVLVDSPLLPFIGSRGNLVVAATNNGNVTYGPGAARTLDADDAFFSGNTIALSTLNVTGDLRLVAANNATVGNTTDINFGGGATTIGGTLEATAVGAITDTNTVQVAGTSAFTASDSISLDLLDAAGTIFLDSALFTSITNARAIDLGASVVGGDLSARSLAGGITDSGNVTVAGRASYDTTLAGDITLDSTTAVGGFDLSTADGHASLAGNDLTLNTALINGDFVLLADSFVFTGNASATGNAEFTGDGEATGAGNQSITAVNGALTLNDQLLKTTSGDLSLSAGGLMTLGGDLDSADGSLRLNAAGRADVPDRATIVALPDGMGTLKLSASESVVIGRREKLTALGSLVIEAGDEIRTGDLNALRDLTLTAPTLTFLTREGAPLLEPAGLGVALSDDPDTGVDLIAGGRIDLVAASVVIDRESASDAAPIIASDGDAVVGAGVLSVRQFVSELTLGDFLAAGIVLDLAAPSILGPNPAGIEGDDGRRDIVRDPQLDPATADQLARLGVPVRSPEPAERVSAVSGRGFYDDVSELTLGAAAVRLSGNVARRLVADYDAFAGENFERVPEIRSTLASLYAGFLAQAPEEERASPVALATYVRTQGGADTLDRIAGIDQLLSNLGLTEPELRVARERLLGRFLPGGLALDQLRVSAAQQGQI